MYGVPTPRRVAREGELGVLRAGSLDDQPADAQPAASATTSYIGGYPEQHLGPALFQPTRNFTFPAVTGIELQGRHAASRRRLRPLRQRQDGAKVNLGKYIARRVHASATRPASPRRRRGPGTTDRSRSAIRVAATAIRTAISSTCRPNGECGDASRASTSARRRRSPRSTRTRASGGATAPTTGSSRPACSTSSCRASASTSATSAAGSATSWSIDNRGRTAADFDPFSVTAPRRSAAARRRRLRRRRALQPQPDKVGLARQLHDVRERLRRADRALERRGLQRQRAARSNGIMLQGGISTGRTATDNCDVDRQRSGRRLRRGASDKPEPALLPRPGGVPDAGQAARHLHRPEGGREPRGDAPELAGADAHRELHRSPTRRSSRRSAGRCPAAPPTRPSTWSSRATLYGDRAQSVRSAASRRRSGSADGARR